MDFPRFAFHAGLSVLASLAMAPAALAGTKFVVTGDTLAITGDAGANDVRIDYTDSTHSWDITVGGGIDSADGCELLSPTSLRCPHTSIVDVAGTSYTGTEGMGAGSDSFKIGYGADEVGADHLGDAWTLRVDLGPGDDFFGGSEAEDVVMGEEGDDVLDGGEGDDWLSGGELTPLDHPGPSQGSDEVFGGPGWDVIYDGDLTSNRGADVLDGGSCPQPAHASCPAIPSGENSDDQDYVYYNVRTAGLIVNLANEFASQGESGEGDNLRNVERAYTGDGADTVTGNAGVNEFVTQGGDDTIDVSGDPGYVDEVFCGAGANSVTIDSGDYIDLDCVPRPTPPIGPPLPPPATGPAPPSPLRPVPPPRTFGRTGNALAAFVAQELAQAGRSLRRCGTTGLLRRTGCRDSFTAVRRGTVVYRLTAPAAGTGAARSVIAQGGRKIPAAGRYPVRIKATRKGRLRLRKGGTLRARLTITFTDSAGKRAKRSREVVLGRKK